jgi:hypothetical protein
MTALDLSADFFFQDPYPTYQKMRELKTCYWLENHDRTDFDGAWMVSRYADVVKVLRSSHGTSVDVKRLVPEPQWHSFDYTLLFTDPPDHTRLRALISASFSNARVRQLEEGITRIVDQLIDNLLQRGKVDFQQEFALPLPMMVISGLWVPRDSGCCGTTSDLTTGMDSTAVNEEVLKAGHGIAGLGEYFDLLAGAAASGSIIERLYQKCRLFSVGSFGPLPVYCSGHERRSTCSQAKFSLCPTPGDGEPRTIRFDG